MQYTLRNIPQELDRALRRRAREEGKSLNAVAVEALLAGSGVSEPPRSRRDLRDVAGTWVADPEVDAVLSDQRRIDSNSWSWDSPSTPTATGIIVLAELPQLRRI
jgi:hypothetical protein